MTIRRTTTLRQQLAAGVPIIEALAHGRLYVYSGAQPSTADEAPTGTNLAIYTLAAGAYTAPVASRASITVVGGSGSIDTIKVGGAIPLIGAAVSYTVGVNETAAAVAAAINAYYNPLGITATSSEAVVTLYAPLKMGAVADGLTLAITQTTLTSTVNGGSSAAFGGAGSPGAGTTAINGLNFLYPPVAGVLSKEAGNWQGTVLATGTAGYFRYCALGSSATGVAGTEIRFDGSIATSGADLNLSSTAFTVGQSKTIDTFSVTVPI